MSYDTNRDKITVEGVVYDVERDSLHNGGDRLTISRDGEPVFEGIEGRIGYDEDPYSANPRDWSNVGTMFCDYRNYILGDKGAPDPRGQTVACPRCDGDGEDPERWALYSKEARTVVASGTEQAMEAIYDERLHYEPEPANCTHCKGEIELDIAEYLRRTHGARVILPLFVYEHSGITMSSGEPIGQKIKPADFDRHGRYAMDPDAWDTSCVGVIFDTPEGVEQCIGKNATDEQIRAALESEVKVYAAYLEGDVTEFSVKDEETGFSESCGGFVGCRDACEEECFAALESAIEKRLAELREREEMAARDIVTI